jgi:hypothetical protein
MPLTQFAVTNAAVKDKPYKLTDGDGLHLLVRPNGSKLWRMRYRFNGQENTLARPGQRPSPLKCDACKKSLCRNGFSGSSALQAWSVAAQHFSQNALLAAGTALKSWSTGGPLRLHKRTSSARPTMSALGQQQTSAVSRCDS